MAPVYNVSEITNILSGTIQRNVSVQGEVEILTDGPSQAFHLINEANKLRCFIPQGVMAMAPALKQGLVVVVDGRITLFPSFSQYQITVGKIHVNGVKAKPFSVTEITEKISSLVAGTSELQNIQIQGKVFPPVDSNWELWDVNIGKSQRIKCVFGPAIGPGQVGNNVCVRGGVSVFPSESEYQINVADIDPIPEDNMPPTCRCPGCNFCCPQEGNQLCPPLINPGHQLCAKCYHESPDREDRVAQAVYAYFDALGGNGFSPQKEWQIQIGSENRIADVVLINENKSFLSIAECKGAGFEGDGREQLYSYLSATDTRFGVFANRSDPSHWEFYENRRRNRFERVGRDEFKDGVVKCLTEETKTLENYKSELHEEIPRKLDHLLEEKMQRLESSLSELKMELQKRKSELHEEIHRKLDHLLEEKMRRLEQPLSELKIEFQKRSIVNWFKNLFSKENE